MAPATPARARIPRAVLVGLVVGWIVIAAKCLLTPWAVAHWSIPIRPAWVIVPTLLFALVVTALAVTHDWNRDRETDSNA